MKKVLLVKEKHGDSVFDISTPELRDKTYLKVFNNFDEEGFYEELNSMQSKLYEDAKKGDVVAARKIVTSRSGDDFEHENVEEVEVENS